ncbi:MAG TPA: HNH endonuclease signature motif containing protein [Flavobacteriaceae bacterium]|nr:HNH endonuclease signature motif containing protein [Flavobacteriaceae bacterium]
MIGCRNLTTGKYCDQHQDKLLEEKRYRNKQYDRYKRDKEATAFYNSIQWRALRYQAMVRDNHLCQHCIKDKKITYAEVVDHIIPIKVDWSKRLKKSNLQSLCDTCHKSKTAEDKRKYKI